MAYRDEFREVERQAFWSLPRTAFFVVIVMIALYGIGFLATGGDLAIYRFWASKQANAERVVFENTQSYVQGKTEYISKLRYDYQRADGSQRESLKQLILAEASTVDNSKLPPDLQGFVRQLRGQL